MRQNLRVLAIALLLILGAQALIGCSKGDDSATTGAPTNSTPVSAPTGTPPSETAASSSEGAGDAANYPAWAQAVVPPYPNIAKVDGASQGILMNDTAYQIGTVDDVATVVAWYKSKAKGDWHVDAGTGNGQATINKVNIEIVKKTDTSSPVKTVVMMTKG